ncbi:hypothetical protein [Absidia glauca]|uniref:Ndc10 domain-containing protein n=1 Tax=Absidia glauca TaxID=4829 RepID=A0A168S1S0_ABSGL|nr:hypothetical protein [Absidia glauca]
MKVSRLSRSSKKSKSRRLKSSIFLTGGNQAGGQFGIKIKRPHQAQEWPYSSHRESIGKTLSSPDIRYNNKTHIVGASKDHLRRQGRWKSQ